MSIKHVVFYHLFRLVTIYFSHASVHESAFDFRRMKPEITRIAIVGEEEETLRRIDGKR